MPRKIFFIILTSALWLGCKKNNSSSSEPPLTDAELDVRVLTSGLSHPWELVWGPDNKIWMTERNGRVSRVDPATGQAEPLLTITDVRDVGEGGLLGMALHPGFSANSQVFLVYNYDKDGTYTEKVVRYTFNGSTLVNPVTILDNIAAANFHDGSRLLFGPDQKLYITTGDAGNTSRSQSRQSINGKVLRLNADGTIPADNPDPTSAVWTTGHRNAQGLAFANGKLYSSEHGPNTDDEINIINKAANYGWPIVNGPCDQPQEQSFCDENNVAQPIHSWTPTIAPSGMEFYSSDTIPQWKNSILLAVLKGSVLLQLKLSTDGSRIEGVNEFLKGQYGRLRDVCISPDGKVYVATDNGSDQILVISRKN